jgi:hypothetical protein
LNDTPAPPAPTYPSVTDPVARALDWTGKVLFRPFDVAKWCVLGFCAWLASLGEGGGGGAHHRWDLTRDDIRYQVERAQDWAVAHLALVVYLAVLLTLLGIALWLLFTWLSSRGKFMFLDGVVHDRGAVVEPWHRFRTQGNSLFFFRIALTMVAVFVIGAAVGLMVLSLLATGLTSHDPGPAGIALICLWVLAIIGLGLIVGLVAVAANDFVVPVMWVRGSRVMEAWSEFLSLLSARLGLFVLYLLLKILIVVVLVGISCAAVCVTCCIAALPYIGTVILLPLHVFKRSFSIYFLSQLDPDYAPLAPVVTPPSEPPAPAATDAPA